MGRPLTLRFAKMSGAGNDFVLLDTTRRRNGRSTPARLGLAALAKRLCDRREGIGGDGLIHLSFGGRGSPRMRYFNADGSEAFCGNGTRCSAWWAHQSGRMRAREFTLLTQAGDLRARIAGRERVAIRLPVPGIVSAPRLLSIGGRRLMVYFVDTGVPHAVVETADLGRFPVHEIGRALRRHPIFKPAGANADFVAFGRREIAVRTYERGVEDETLACGTGAAAAALVGLHLGKCRSPVSVRVKSGARLRVHVETGDDPAELWLEGPARTVYQGSIRL
jgi:diaminopimelate epimerase